MYVCGWEEIPKHICDEPEAILDCYIFEIGLEKEVEILEKPIVEPGVEY